jgi:hypothetical protein
MESVFAGKVTDGTLGSRSKLTPLFLPLIPNKGAKTRRQASSFRQWLEKSVPEGPDESSPARSAGK